MPNIELEIQFINACKNGDLTLIENLLPKVEANHYSATSLAEAASHGHLPVVEYLITHGTHLFTQPKMNSIKNALLESVVKNHVHILEYLIDKGCDIHFGNETLLYYACRHGKLQSVQILIENGANIHIPVDLDELFSAKLIEQNRNMECYQYQSIHTALLCGHLNIVLYLVTAKQLDLNIFIDSFVCKPEMKEFLIQYQQSKELHDSFENDLPKNKNYNNKIKI